MNPCLKNWARYEPSDKAPWNLQRVVHLHRRAGFLAPWSILQRDLADEPRLAIGRLIDGDLGDEDDEAMVETIGQAAIASSNPQRLKAWWLYRMMSTTDPLRERVALMWHNHFATSNRKVKNLSHMHSQNELVRRYGQDSFQELLGAVVKHPALLIWLDADSNRKGKANENLARELLELFTIGVGNFSENDVKETARALTGWTVINDRFEFRQARHDDEPLTILGTTKPYNGDELLQLLVSQPETAKRITWRICKTFMGENVVSKEALGELADGLMARDLSVAWAIETVLRSELFFSKANIRSKVLGPVEYMIGAIRSLELADSPPSSMILAQWITRMGQELFYPPNVGGWKEGRAWLSSRTIVARANFADAMAKGELWSPKRIPNLRELANRYDIAEDLASRVQWLCKLLWGEVSVEVTDQVLKSTEGKKVDLAEIASLLLARPEHQLG